MNNPIRVTPAAGAASGAFTSPIRTHGLFALRFFIPGVTANSVVMVSLCETDSNGTPIDGQALMKVYNVVPLGDGVESVDVRGEIDWDVDLTARVSFLVG
ncbi:hypothetical protein [Streptomyces celluloflavus]|uniref:hypothetical protein n=1 Tax=Streptomyces celluloflavus TaxID=58344 RepID=UPI0036C4E8B9